MAHHHDCECGHDHHHEHEHESNSVQIDRYHEAFNKFEPALPDTQTTEAVNALLEKHFQENFTPEVLKTIHGCIDLTSLTSLDTKESIWKMVDTVNDFEGTRPDVPNVAAICVYPLFVETVKQALTAQEVKIASVAGGFPSSQTFTEVKIAETAMAVMQGADEIDVVMNLGYFMEDNFEELTEADIVGLLYDKDDESTLIPEVEVSEIEGYKQAGVIAGGMLPKIEGMAEAIYKGVHEAVIIDGRVPHSILLEMFSDRGAGTMFYRRGNR